MLLPCGGGGGGVVVHCWELGRCLASVRLLSRNPCSQGESKEDSQARVPGLESPQRTARDPGFGKQV